MASTRTHFSHQRAIAELWLDSVQNMTVHGVVLRLFRPACGPQGGPLTLATAISIAVSLVLIAAASLLVRRPRPVKSFDRAFATFATLSVLTSQWAWEHYHVLLVLPVAIAGATVWPAWQSGRRAFAASTGVMLGLVVLSFWLDATTRVALQTAVRAGDRSQHLLLHLYEVANWLPSFLTLGWFLWTLARGEPPRRGVPAASSPRASSQEQDQPEQKGQPAGRFSRGALQAAGAAG